MDNICNITKKADQIIAESQIFESPYFQSLHSGKMSLVGFQKSQSDFFFAVDFFSRPMAALISRLPYHAQRLDILRNIVEEHGHFDKLNYHSTTFKSFLESIGVSTNSIDVETPPEYVNAFNIALMGAALALPTASTIAAIGIIEHAFAHISSIIAKGIILRGWLKGDEIVHYNVHAELDKEHSQEFFRLIDGTSDNCSKEAEVGFRLGIYLFKRLFFDMNHRAS